jgi:ABC-2 type transport system ATP-binding protein
MPSLTATGVTAGYRGRPVIHELNLEFGPGIHLLLGPNGAGKSTTFRVLAGILPPISGNTSVDGRDPATDAAAKAQIGLMLHRSALVAGLSGVDNLEYWARVLGLPPARRAERVAAVVELLGLGAFARRRASELSRGQCQRVALARAFLTEAPILLLDEPLSGVDPDVAGDLRIRLRGFAEAGHTIVLSTHDLAEAGELADDVTVLREGRIVGQGRPGALRTELVGSGYSLRLRGGAGLDAALERAGRALQAVPRAGEAVVAVADDADTARLIAELVHAGVDVYEARPHGNALEEVYRTLGHPAGEKAVGT